MRSRRWYRPLPWASLLLVMALVASACQGGDGETATEGGGQTGQETGEASGEPIRIGGSLSLTGFLAPNGLIHKVAGELYVDRLNEAGGLLGRPVEFVIIDDESSEDKAAAAYERLITEEQVDLIMGPYGTGTIAAALQVAERHGYAIPHHTGSLTYAYTYDCAFPAWSSGRYPNQTIMGDILDMLEATDDPPQTIGFLVNQFPGSNYVAYGTDEGDPQDATGAVQVAKERGYEVVLDVAYPTEISDFGPLAARVREANPDFLWVGGLGLDAANLIQAMEALNYRPKGEFYLWSAPAPLEEMGEPAEGAMLASMFELTMPQAQTPEVQEIAGEFATRAEAEGAYPLFTTQAAASWMAWDFLVAGVEGAGSLEQDTICEWLQNNPVETTTGGTVDFRLEENNYYGDRSKVAQWQGDAWETVWPEEHQSTDLMWPAPVATE
jgi:branched-chain amino acid transport system substrate-binding protein